jgi:ACS family tartrate transporter-like MFS transporter
MSVDAGTTVSAADRLDDRLMAIVWPKPADTIGERSRRRITLRLMPVLFVLYILAYLDRANVSVAKLDMALPLGSGGLGFDQKVLGFGAGLFFLGYWILEIPTALSIRRLGARWVFCRILILWGLCATLMGFIGLPIANKMFAWLPTLSTGDGQWFHRTIAYFNDLPTSAENQFYFFRFMLGFFEGGFFPCVIVYLTYWFRPEDRAKAVAGFCAASPLSLALGMPASGLLLPVHWFGLAGWRWVFIVEGLAPVLAGFAVLWCLPVRPELARWLPADERDWLAAELERERLGKQAHSHSAWLPQVGRVVLLTAVYFCLNVGVYGLVIFTPSIVNSVLAPWLSTLGDWKSAVATMIASLPFFAALVGIYFNGWHSDRTGERVWHTATPLLIVSAGMLLTAIFYHVPAVPVLILIFVIGPAMFAHMPTFWPIPTMFLGAAAAASAIGLINMLGNLGGYLGPRLVGDASEPAPAQVAGDVSKAADNGPTRSPDAGSPPKSAIAPIASTPTIAQPGANASASDDYRNSLFLLAPWPLAAAIMVVFVGYIRGPTSRQPAPAG